MTESTDSTIWRGNNLPASPPAAWPRALRCLLGAVLLFTCSRALPAEVRLRVLETTDLHMHLVGYDYYRDRVSATAGLDRTAALIAAARREVANSVLVDNGDLLQGNPMGDYAARGRVLRYGEVHPAFKAMNLLGYDVGNIGNHDLNYGLDFLLKALRGADFPYISANIVVADGDADEGDDQPYFRPYVILPKTVVDDAGNRQRLNIGYIGLVPPQIMDWDRDKLSGLVEARDIVDSARRYVPEMRARGADVVIAVAHSGMYDDKRRGMDENAVYYLAKVGGIDAILFGHSHRVFPGDEIFNAFAGIDNRRGTVFGVPAVMAGFWGSHLGVVDLQLKTEHGRWRVIGGHAEARPIYRREHGDIVPLVEPVKAITNAVAADHRATRRYMAKKVGVTPIAINSYFAMVEDDPSVQLVNNAQLWYAHKIIRGTAYADLPLLAAASPFKTGGGAGPDYYTQVPAGPIALRHVADLYIYPNDLKIVLLTGRQVRAWLEKSAAVFNTIDPQSTDGQWLVNEKVPGYNFDVIDGVTYEIDVTRPAWKPAAGGPKPGEGRIRNLQYGDEPIDPAQKFLVVTNSYRAGGGGHFPALDGSTTVIDAPDKNRDAIAAYFLSRPALDPSPDGNWKFAATTGRALIYFRSTPKARALASGNIRFIKIMDDGFAQFSLRP